MGIDADFIAFPEDCELLHEARRNIDIAHSLAYLRYYVEPNSRHAKSNDPDNVRLRNAALKLFDEHPGLIDRYYSERGRNWATIMYLISPTDYLSKRENRTLIEKAYYGFEPLHPEVRVRGLVRRGDVHALSAYLNTITREQLHSNFPPKQRIYKCGPDADEERFEVIWQDFVGMRNLYNMAMEHGEAVVTCLE